MKYNKQYWTIGAGGNGKKFIANKIIAVDYGVNKNLSRMSKEDLQIEFGRNDIKAVEFNKFINELINFISKRKETIAIDDYMPEFIKKTLGLPTQKLMMKFYDAYIDFCEENNCLDFADLMLKCYLMFKNNEKVLNHYQNRFQVILVDEFQDTN